MISILLDPAIRLAGELAALTTLILAIAGFLIGRRISLHLAGLIFATVFFLGLTQLPLPDQGQLRFQCPLAAAEPNWIPLYTAVQILQEATGDRSDPDRLPVQVWSQGPSAVRVWLARDAMRPPLKGGWGFPAMMNLLACLPIGALLVPYVRRVQGALAAGLALSLLVELTQLTGTWGLYRCAYRKFDADDIILNVLGLTLGFLAARRWTSRRLSARPR